MKPTAPRNIWVNPLKLNDGLVRLVAIQHRNSNSGSCRKADPCPADEVCLNACLDLSGCFSPRIFGNIFFRNWEIEILKMQGGRYGSHTLDLSFRGCPGPHTVIQCRTSRGFAKCPCVCWWHGLQIHFAKRCFSCCSSKMRRAIGGHVMKSSKARSVSYEPCPIR